ncbi:MAG: hypothetical protein QOG80_1553 [Pseudonocardiales bacterium]|jgi:hypothetical protein|nr:hypothetical protein [Pseudonocardiales bacterium]
MKFVRWTLVVVAVVGLGIDAWTHFDLAALYSHNTTGTVNEGVLFQIEAVLAILAGLLLVWRQNILTSSFAVLVTGGGAFALLLYRYVDVGKIGPIPSMYDPEWFTEKQVSLAGEFIALGAALLLLGLAVHSRLAGVPVGKRSAHPVAA